MDTVLFDDKDLPEVSSCGDREGDAGIICPFDRIIKEVFVIHSEFFQQITGEKPESTGIQSFNEFKDHVARLIRFIQN
jgi:hypothetical protein